MTAAGCNSQKLAAEQECFPRFVTFLAAGAEGQIALRIVRELANAGEKVVAGAQAQVVPTCGYNDVLHEQHQIMQQVSNGCMP
jgi:hypothetical protein